MEEWRVIPEDMFPELQALYAVSSLGRVQRIGTRRVLNTRERIRKEKGETKGYMQVELSTPYLRDSGAYRGRRKYLVHRLVAGAFVMDGRDSQKEVHHIDGDKHNNVPGNLMWVTAKEHYAQEKSSRQQHVRKYSQEHHDEISKRMSERWELGVMHKREQMIYGTDLDGIVRFAYTRIQDAKLDGFNPKGISQNLAGKSKSSGGIMWHKVE